MSTHTLPTTTAPAPRARAARVTRTPRFRRADVAGVALAVLTGAAAAVGTSAWMVQSIHIL